MIANCTGGELMNVLSRRSLCVVVLLVTSTLLLGCAEEREPINRVGAGALTKSFFVGALADRDDDPEFFMRVTVIDAASGAGNDGLFTSSDGQPTNRVRWEITEKLLLARLTYELVEGTDGKGLRRVADGQVVAAYTIEKHFDVSREYNPSTGEEYNVIVENEEDQLWHQRSHFRVDWSKNLFTDAYQLDTLSQLGIYYGVTWDPVAYYVNEPDHPHAPVFDLTRGYFDVTNKAWASPELIDDPWWGPTPACWFTGYFPTTSCNPSEITLRQSFLRVTDTDYEPKHWDGTRMDMFGVFTVDRLGYDRRYGVVDDKWHRFAARWNLFVRSHAEPPVVCASPETTPTGKSPNRDENANGTEDECEVVGRGSRCDRFVGACTLPVRDRQVKTIAWHVNRDMPADLFDSSREALQAWSDAVRVALIAGRLTECRRSGESDCEKTMGWPQPWSDNWLPAVVTEAGATATPDQVPEVFVLCHNPVVAGDHQACGALGLSPRLGDLRFNILSVINEAQVMAPWGIMVDAEDPLTGEKISGSVNVWGAVLDRAAATLVDLLALLNGQTDPADFITGQDVSAWVKANSPGGVVEQGGAAMSAAELGSRKAAFDSSAISPYLDGLPVSKHKHPRARRKQRLQALLAQGRLGPGNTVLSQRMKALQDGAVEAALVSPQLAQAVGYDPTAPLSADAMRRASPLRRSNPMVRRAERRAARMAQVRRHACRLEAPEPDSLLGLAKLAQKLFPAPDPGDAEAVKKHRDEVYLWARQAYNRGVMAHELGHSMGLRHNFAASFDALNYEPQYWQLRTSNGTITTDCPEGTTDGSACVGPRWRDPLSEAEIDGNIGQYATSSVMDYPGDNSQDTILPGKYDRAAMRFVYGDTVDVWAGAGLSVSPGSAERAKAYELTALAANPGLFGVYYFPPVDVADPYRFMHYSRYQSEFGLLGSCEASNAPDAVMGSTCSEAALDVVDYRDTVNFIDDPDYASFSWAYIPRAVDLQGRVRRGYLFSSDEYADAGNVPAFSMDAGADAYEQVRFFEGQYENRYILDAFRRKRVQFNSGDTTMRIQARYLDAIQQIAKTFAFGALLEGDPAAPATSLLQDGFYGPLALSGTVALDLFARILTRPEPGYYCPADACGTGQPLGVDDELYSTDVAPLPDIYLYDFRVLLGDGRYLHNDYDYNQGYWWGDYQTQVGAYYEKIWATYYLAEAFDYFISSAKEDFTDSRYKNVNFATVYPEQVRRLYNNLLTGDVQAYAPWVVPPLAPDDTPVATLEYPTWHAVNDADPRPAGALLADPNYAFNEQIYAMVWGTFFFTTNWSQSFVHQARITVLPAEQPDWPLAEIYKFYNPATGLRYAARSYGTEMVLGVEHQKAAGARMLEWANKLLTEAYLVQLDLGGDPIVDAFGTPMLELDAQGKPQLNPAKPGADAVLQRYVDNIDTFRQLTALFEQPLSDDELPQP